jgi:5'-3' exonuclease
MKRYLIIDLMNTFFRAKHAAHRGADAWQKVGFAIHVTLASVAACWREQKADHVVFCLEGRSWRKDFYKPYKANRAVARAALTEEQLEEEKLFNDAYNDLIKFLYEKTNCTMLKHSQLEADDLIAGWIQTHPNDEHVIISTDSDFVQLLAPNVKQYNGVAEELLTIQGIFDKRGKLVLDKKTKEPKTIPDPAWLLFEKCIRGDSTDNVFSALPGARIKGSKNKVGLLEAYADRDKKGFAWNSIMLSRWVDHEDVEHRVLDDYERNRILIDLTAQPEDIKQKMYDCIHEAAVPKTNTMVGAKFLKFCTQYELTNIRDRSEHFAQFMQAAYV